MKANRLICLAVLLLLGATAVPLHAEQAKADRKLLADIRAKAERGDAQSQLDLGCLFYSGALGGAKDYAEAVKWYRRAAEQNHAAAQYSLGVCYKNGSGVAENAVEAVKWYRKAAEQNLAQAQFSLGRCFERGQGVAKNEVEAVKWYRKGAEQ